MGNGQTCCAEKSLSGQEMILVDITNAYGKHPISTDERFNSVFDFNGDYGGRSLTQKIKLKDGSIYQGGLMHGKMHGYGMLLSPDKKVYEGEFFDGRREGHGSLTFGDGRVYIGPFVNDRMHGQGKLIGSFGEAYSCTAKFGRIEGHSF